MRERKEEREREREEGEMSNILLHVHASHKQSLTPPPQFSKLGIQMSLSLYINFVCLGYGWAGYFTLSFFLLC